MREARISEVNRVYRNPDVVLTRPPWWRDPWLLAGVVVAGLLTVGWRNVPPATSGDPRPLPRVAVIVVCLGPVLAIAGWLAAHARSTTGRSWVAAGAVTFAGFWTWLVVTVAAYVTDAPGVCAGVAGPCPSVAEDRLAAVAAAGVLWAGASGFERRLVRRARRGLAPVRSGAGTD